MSSGVPPGVINQSFYVSLNAFKFVQIMTLSVLAWEIIVTLPMERALYKRGFQWTYAVLTFSRYYTLACLVLDVALNTATGVSAEFCFRVRWVLPFVATTIQFVSIPLFLARTYAICGKSKLILPLLIVFWIAPMAIGTYVSTTYDGVPYALVIGLDVVGGCANDPRNALSAAAPYITNLIVDSCLLFLTLGRLIQLQGGTQMSIVRRLLIRDGILYYVVVVVVNIINLVFFLAPGLLPLERPLIATPAGVAPTIMIGRLFFNLQYSFLANSPEDISELTSIRQRSTNRNITTIGDDSRDSYPMRPIQVAYSVNTSKHTDGVESCRGLHDEDRRNDVKKGTVAGYV